MIDVYVDYGGTLWTNILGRTDTPPRRGDAGGLTERCGRATACGCSGLWASRMPMRWRCGGTRARRWASDARRSGPRRARPALGADLEFLTRPEWRAVQRRLSACASPTQRSYSPTFMYRALSDGSADVDHRLLVRRPDRGRSIWSPSPIPAARLPSYEALLLVSPRRARDWPLHRSAGPADRRDLRRADAPGQSDGRSRHGQAHARRRRRAG